MATYKKQLRDKDNNVIYPAQGLGTIVNDNIDWTTTAQSYSTTEVDTGATWIDGKPIYKKTVYKSSISSGDIDTAHGISNISKIIKHEAFYVTSGSYKQLPIVANTSGGNYSVVWAVNSTYINTVSTATLSDFYITLWYTKTTD